LLLASRKSQRRSLTKPIAQRDALPEVGSNQRMALSAGAEDRPQPVSRSRGQPRADDLASPADDLPLFDEIGRIRGIASEQLIAAVASQHHTDTTRCRALPQ